MVKFEDLGLQLNDKTKEIKCGEDIVVTVKQYLPIKEKVELMQFVNRFAIDDTTGCSSPLRVEVFFSIGICMWYTDIEIDKTPLSNYEVYDLLDSSGLLDQIMNAIPDEELTFIKDLVEETIVDIVKYNNSAAGIIQAMSFNAQGLDTQITDILEKIKNGEGLETLSIIKDVVGTD